MTRLLGFAIVAWGVLAAAPARAQLCHAAADDDDAFADDAADGSMDMSHMDAADMAAMHHRRTPPRDAIDAVSARAGVEGAYATISEGTYQGLTPSLAVSWWRFDASVAAPVYHLEYRGVKSDGPGDVLLSLEGAAYATRRVRAGLALSVTVPSGNDKLGLGMGNPMWMPGAWGAWTDGRLGVIASASYGFMQEPAGTVGHHHGPDDVGSLVNPMNHQELAGAVRATYRATRDMRVHLLGSIATPVGDTGGVTRGYAAAGTRYRLGAWEIGVEAALPITGAPFLGRMAIELARTF